MRGMAWPGVAWRGLESPAETIVAFVWRSTHGLELAAAFGAGLGGGTAVPGRSG